MVLHIALRAKAQPAIKGACKRPLIAMDSDMNLEILPLAECPSAPGKGTAERLRSVMQVHVGAEANFPRELLVTSRVLAGERFPWAALAGLEGEMLPLFLAAD